MHVQHTFFLISKKQLYTLFLYISLPLFCTTTTWNFQKLPSYTSYGGNVVCVPVHFFSAATHFHLGGSWHSPFSHRRYKIYVFLPTKLLSFVFCLALCLLSTSRPGGYAIYRRNGRMLEMQTFIPAYKSGRKYGRTPYGRFSQNQNFLDA